MIHSPGNISSEQIFYKSLTIIDGEWSDNASFKLLDTVVKKKLTLNYLYLI